MSAEPLRECPECLQPNLIKLIGSGAAVIVKGTKTPCRGNRGGTTKKVTSTPKQSDKLGEGKFKSEKPFWRDGKIDQRVLKDPKKYIAEGNID
jgi:hypothetical protein